jgi:glycosyltransferase involved in cell wall biosynthesis
MECAAAPIVSVVIPVKNRRRTIARAVRSALRQEGFPPGTMEILVVDDGSTDGTAEVVRPMVGTSAQTVRLLANERAPGANGARNTGILAGRGTWIALLDSDDAWAPDKLRRQLRALHEHRCGAATCSWITIGTDGRQEHRVYPRDIRFHGWDLSARLAWKTGFGTQTLMVHRDVIRHAGLFDESLRRRQDYEWTIRLAQQGPIVAVARAVVMIYQQRTSIMSDPTLVWPATRAIVSRHRWLYARHPGSLLGQCLRCVRLVRLARRMA